MTTITIINYGLIILKLSFSLLILEIKRGVAKNLPIKVRNSSWDDIKYIRTYDNGEWVEVFAKPED